MATDPIFDQLDLKNCQVPGAQWHQCVYCKSFVHPFLSLVTIFVHTSPQDNAITAKFMSEIFQVRTFSPDIPIL